MNNSNRPNTPDVANTDTQDCYGLQKEIEHFEQLRDSMHDAQGSRTMEEQVAYLKSKGIDPAKTYRKWDDEQED